MTEKMVSLHGTGYIWQGISGCNFFKLLKMIDNISNDNDNDNDNDI